MHEADTTTTNTTILGGHGLDFGVQQDRHGGDLAFVFRGAFTCFPNLFVPVWTLYVVVCEDFCFSLSLARWVRTGVIPHTGIDMYEQGQASLDIRQRGNVLYLFFFERERGLAKGQKRTSCHVCAMRKRKGQKKPDALDERSFGILVLAIPMMASKQAKHFSSLRSLY